MSIHKKTFGQLPDGSKVTLFSLRNANGMTAAVMNYGATLASLNVPDREGNYADVVLGFDTLDDYLLYNRPYLGSVIGRFANRIAGSRFYEKPI